MISNKSTSDPIEKLIFEGNLRVKQVLIDKSLDIMVVLFNNAKLIHLKLSEFPKLHGASEESLRAWELIGGGIGLHWPALDEDLSVKGLIHKAAISNAVRELGQG